MIVNLRFNYSRAQNFLSSINKCSNSLNGLAKDLDIEISKTGAWWQGDSYDDYKELFAGKNGYKALIERTADTTSSVSSYLVKVAQTLRDWEKNVKSFFK